MNFRELPHRGLDILWSLPLKYEERSRRFFGQTRLQQQTNLEFSSEGGHNFQEVNVFVVFNVYGSSFFILRYLYSLWGFFSVLHL